MVYISSKLYMCNDLAGGNHQSLYACRKAAAQARQQDACALLLRVLASTAAPPVFHKAFLKLRWFKARKSTARLQQVPIFIGFRRHRQPTNSQKRCVRILIDLCMLAVQL